MTQNQFRPLTVNRFTSASNLNSVGLASRAYLHSASGKRKMNTISKIKIDVNESNLNLP